MLSLNSDSLPSSGPGGALDGGRHEAPGLRALGQGPGARLCWGPVARLLGTLRHWGSCIRGSQSPSMWAVRVAASHCSGDEPFSASSALSWAETSGTLQEVRPLVTVTCSRCQASRDREGPARPNSTLGGTPRALRPEGASPGPGGAQVHEHWTVPCCPGPGAAQASVDKVAPKSSSGPATPACPDERPLPEAGSEMPSELSLPTCLYWPQILVTVATSPLWRVSSSRRPVCSRSPVTALPCLRQAVGCSSEQGDLPALGDKSADHGLLIPHDMGGNGLGRSSGQR